MSRGVKSAVALISRAPAHKRTDAVKQVARLRELGTGDVDAVLIDGLLGRVLQRSRVVYCAYANDEGSGDAPTAEDSTSSSALAVVRQQRRASSSSKPCGRTFVACEYNREADGYRCPYCNRFTTLRGERYLIEPSGEEAADRANKRRVKKLTRALEKQFMMAMYEYAFLYYGSTAAITCSVWPSSDDASAAELGIAVVIVNEVPVDAEEDDEQQPDGEGSTERSKTEEGGHGRQQSKTKPKFSVWNSTHVIYYSETANRLTTCDTTIHVDVYSGLVRLSGFRTSSSSLNRPVKSNTWPEIVATVGDYVQSIENELRGSIVGIGFNKASQVLQLLGPASASLEANGVMLSATAGGPAATSAPGEDAAEEGVAAQREETGQLADDAGTNDGGTVTLPPGWTYDYDAEGTIYYYHKKTLQSQYEVPTHHAS